MPTWPDSGFVLPPDFPSADWLFDQPAAPDHPTYPPQNPPNPPWTPDAPLLPPPAWPQAPPVPDGAQPPAPPSLPDFPNLAMDNYYGDSYGWEEGGEEEGDAMGTMRVMSVEDGEVVDPADSQQQTGLVEGLRPVLRPHQGHVNGGYETLSFTAPTRTQSCVSPMTTSAARRAAAVSLGRLPLNPPTHRRLALAPSPTTIGLGSRSAHNRVSHRPRPS